MCGTASLVSLMQAIFTYFPISAFRVSDPIGCRSREPQHPLARLQHMLTFDLSFANPSWIPDGGLCEKNFREHACREQHQHCHEDVVIWEFVPLSSRTWAPHKGPADLLQMPPPPAPDKLRPGEHSTRRLTEGPTSPLPTCTCVKPVASCD